VDGDAWAKGAVIAGMAYQWVPGGNVEGDVEICTLGGVPHVLLTSLAHEGRT
jgi:hypothetical protein